MLGHLPQTGESADLNGSRLTVTELDGRRIARVKISAVGKSPGPAARPSSRPAHGQAAGAGQASQVS